MVKVTDGAAVGHMVETVLIPVTRGEKDRITVCVSSQVGCAMGCKFCFTGTIGLQANLSVAQIVEQVATAGQKPKLTRMIGLAQLGF